MTVANETERLARAVLRTAYRMQARGTTVRLVVPRAPEVTRELAPTPTESELLSAEEYLLDRDYLAPTDIGLTCGTYTITPAGLEWLEGDLPEPSPTDRLRELAGRLGEEATRAADFRVRLELAERAECTTQAELEEVRRRLRESERQRDELRRELEAFGGSREASQTAPKEPTRAECPATGGPQSGTSRPWWRRMFGA